jgi:hypothetical protein
MKNHLLLGNWNALCDSCGRKFKALDLKKRWDGLMVCQEDYENRHPSDFLRVQKEKINVDFARPYPAQDTYVGYVCSVYELSGADKASADCARANSNILTGTFDEETNFIYEDDYAAIAGLAIAGWAIAGHVYSLSPGA